MKTFAFAAAISVVFWSCNALDDEQNAISSSSGVQSSSSFENPSSSSLEGMPIWNSRVVSYKNIGNLYSEPPRFVTDKNTLKSWFPDIFDNENTECNYWAIIDVTSSQPLHYMIISQDMILYTILPSRYVFADDDGVFHTIITPSCGGSEDVVYHAALICDDEIETLRNNIDISFPVHHKYIDPDWDCTKEWVGLNKDVFF